ncbi:MAG: tetratricopeptide repeat protein [Bacteroidetes bacterium]|nr:tetratricopeptide repeat protein [Bacteroidota bacterium]
MKQYIFLLMGLLIGSCVFAQFPVQPGYDKQNSDDLSRSMANLPMISETRSLLELASGWMLQDNGEWISSQNQIPWKDPDLNRSSKPSFKLGKENFINLEVRDVLVNNEMYAVIIIRFKSGWYEFPMLMESWHKQTGVSYFVCKLSKFQGIIPEKMEFNKPYVQNLDVLCDNTLMDFDERYLNSTIAYNIHQILTLKTITPHNLIIAFLPVQAGGQTTARFRIIQVMNKEKFYLPYLDLKNRDKLFKGSYYECDFGSFRSFVNYGGGAYIQSFTGAPKSADEYYKRGLSDYASGNYSQAISNLTEASKYQPYSTFFLTYAYRANAHQKVGDNAAAMMDFDKAISLKPAEQNYYSAWLTVIYNRGVARFNNKDRDGACADWNTALQFGLKDIANDKAIKEHCRGYRYTGPSVSMTQSVVTNFSDMSGPESMTDYFKVYWEGVWKYEHGNFQDALRYFNRAIELRPQDKAFMVYYYRGSCKLKISDFNGALSDLNISLSFNSGSQGDPSMMKLVYYNHGMANYMLGNYPMACSDFQKAVTAGLTTPESLDFIKQVCR